jgi:PKD repeat protein
MVAGQNVFAQYSNASTTCSNTGGVCAAGETLTFTAGQFNYDFGCDSHTFQWTFGDGGTGSGQQTTHVFGNNGTYSVQLKIINSTQTVTVTVPVIVGSTQKPPAAVDFTLTPWTANGVVIPNGYSFTPASTPSGSVTTFQWDFGDGTCPGAGAASCTSSGEIKHVFPTNANYTITLSVAAPSGYSGILAVHPLVTVPPHRHSAPHN